MSFSLCVCVCVCVRERDPEVGDGVEVLAETSSSSLGRPNWSTTKEKGHTPSLVNNTTDDGGQRHRGNLCKPHLYRHHYNNITLI